MNFVAAQGPMVLQAQSGPMSLAALKDLTVSSTDGKVVITAAKEVWIGAGGSYIQINGSGIVNGSPGPILEKGASWDVPGADSMRMPLPAMPLSSLPETPTNPYVQLFDASTVITNLGAGSALDGLPYRVYLADGTLQQQGMLNEGATIKVRTAQSEKVKCEIGAGDWGAIEDAFDQDELDES
jgi:type VI secretion system secreted protein VgrG